MGCPMRVADDKNMSVPVHQTCGSYHGTLEYIVVNSRTSADGNFAGQEEFAWLKIMDRNGLSKIFPESRIEELCQAMRNT